jgi:anti-anti-sigma regulatory factor
VTAPIVLPARLDTAAAHLLAGELRARAGAEVVLDAAHVDLLGAKAMETLLVAALAWQAAGTAFAVTNLTDEVRGQLAALGLPDPSLLEGTAP